MRPALFALLLATSAAVAPTAAMATDWRIDERVGDRLTLRASLSAEACPGWAQGLERFGPARVVADRMVGAQRLVRIAYDQAGVEAECLGGLALLRGPAERLQALVD